MSFVKRLPEETLDNHRGIDIQLLIFVIFAVEEMTMMIFIVSIVKLQKFANLRNLRVVGELNRLSENPHQDHVTVRTNFILSRKWVGQIFLIVT
jgi:hypothetical protein